MVKCIRQTHKEKKVARWMNKSMEQSDYDDSGRIMMVVKINGELSSGTIKTFRSRWVK